jgi:hypothetical protein
LSFDKLAMSEENKKLLVDRYYKSHYFTLLNSIVEKARRADLRLLKLNGEQMDVIVFPRRRWPRMGVVIGIRDRFSFPTGRSGFRQKAALIFFSENLRRSADRRYDCQRTVRPFGGASCLVCFYDLPHLFPLPKERTTGVRFPADGRSSGQSRRLTFQKRGERFSLSWRRGPG